MFECPYCEKELLDWDYWGKGNPFSSDFIKIGDIFICDNEACECYQYSFYTDERDELNEGFPC